MEYLNASDMPNLKRMGKEGGLKAGSSVIPSVTNVNNASVVTGSFPSEHGITTNYHYDRRTKTASEMESADFLLKPTIFEKAKKLGLRTALVSSKDKVKTLCSRGCDIVVSAEKPEPEWIQRIGPKEDNVFRRCELLDFSRGPTNSENRVCRSDVSFDDRLHDAYITLRRKLHLSSTCTGLTNYWLISWMITLVSRST